MIAGYLNLEDCDVKEAPLWWHKQGLQFTATGYSGKIPTQRMIRLQGKWRRVYVACYGNGGTAYVTVGKDWLVIR